jgi:hypothetical protein
MRSGPNLAPGVAMKPKIPHMASLVTEGAGIDKTKDVGAPMALRDCNPAASG